VICHAPQLGVERWLRCVSPRCRVRDKNFDWNVRCLLQWGPSRWHTDTIPAGAQFHGLVATAWRSWSKRYDEKGKRVSRLDCGWQNVVTITPMKAGWESLLRFCGRFVQQVYDCLIAFGDFHNAISRPRYVRAYLLQVAGRVSGEMVIRRGRPASALDRQHIVNENPITRMAAVANYL
jgi:hypothetical protein